MPKMDKAKKQALVASHIVSGCLIGLAQGIGYWRNDTITNEMVGRLQGSLADLRDKATVVADYFQKEIDTDEAMEAAVSDAIAALRLCLANPDLTEGQRVVANDAVEKFFQIKSTWKCESR